MSVGAWIMFLIGAIGLWGGFFYFLWVMFRESKKEKNQQASS